MTVTARCEVTELLVDECACRLHRNLPDPAPDRDLFEAPAAAREARPWFASMYGGDCAGCGDRFDAGDTIRASRAFGGYVAECCGGDE
jgi:hypothetical protein